jgi:hypothetical protein
MTALSQSTKRKLSLLQLADELGNVAKAAASWATTATRSTRSGVPSRPAAWPGWSSNAAAPATPSEPPVRGGRGQGPRILPAGTHPRRPARLQRAAPGRHRGLPFRRS